MAVNIYIYILFNLCMSFQTLMFWTHGSHRRCFLLLCLDGLCRYFASYHWTLEDLDDWEPSQTSLNIRPHSFCIGFTFPLYADTRHSVLLPQLDPRDWQRPYLFLGCKDGDAGHRADWPVALQTGKQTKLMDKQTFFFFNPFLSSVFLFFRFFCILWWGINTAEKWVNHWETWSTQWILFMVSLWRYVLLSHGAG